MTGHIRDTQKVRVFCEFDEVSYEQKRIKRTDFFTVVPCGI